MSAKLKSHIAIAISWLQAAGWLDTIWGSHRLFKHSVLAFLVCLALAVAQPLAAQEYETIEPAGVVSWDELLQAEQRKVATYVTEPKVVPFMPGPKPRSLDDATDGMQPLSSLVEDSAGTGGEPLAVEIVDDFRALGDNNAAIPPDTMGAAGPSHLMTMLNTQVRIQNKTGTTTSTVTLDTFWTNGTGLMGNPFDPKVIYDQISDRWLATVDADSFSATSAVWFAVSDDSDPTGNWTFYAIDADAGNTTWADYPGIGVNSKWVAITNNMFTNVGGNFVGAKMWVIDKSTFGGALGVTTFSPPFDNVGGADGFTLKPAVTFDPAESTLYIVDNSGWSSGGVFMLRLSRITGTGAAPVWSVLPGGPFPGSGLFFVDNNFNFTQIDASQLGTATRVNTNDPRLLNAVCRNGHLWTTHSGGLPADKTANRTAVFWYEIDPTASLNDPIVQSGVVDGGNGVHHFFPSISANFLNDVALGFSRSDSTRYVEGVVTGRASTDPAGSMDTIQVIKAGEDSYVKDFGSGRVRWGDYSATVVDPADDTTLWSIQQYAETDVGPGVDDDRWGTWWARLQLVPPEIDPTQGTIGTEVDITNLSDLGTKSPKVLIGESKCKVLTFTSSSVSCLLKKIKSTNPPGTYDVTIQRKGKRFKGQPPTVLANGFAIMAPSITDINPASGSPKDQVTITGSFFGTKKVKAFMADGIGGKSKKGKTISITMDANTGESALVILVPKKLAPGLYDVIVTNKVGEDTLVGGFTIQ